MIKTSSSKFAAVRAAKIGFVFQSYHLLPEMDVTENVMLPAMTGVVRLTRAQVRGRALALLEQVGLAEQADKLPHAVSGGQQQRAGIARAVAVDPPLIVGDEPTGRLDPQGAEICFGIFEEWVAQGKTMLMVTHDKGLAQRVARKIEIIEGYVTRDEYIGLGHWAGS
jgi:putative ABC transport system ATP-binding protein